MHDILCGESLINDKGRREDDHREEMTSCPGKETFSRACSARCNRPRTERLKDTLIDPHPHSSMDEYGGGCGLDFGHVSVMGRRRVMEDAVVVAPPVRLAGEYSFFAVYDGHGGAEVAEGCCERLHVCLEKHVEEAARLQEEEEFDWEKVMGECFSAMDEEFRSAAEVGSTAVVVLVGEEEVVVANCGDSRAVLCRDGVPVPLSRDHKPDQPDEKRRIEAAGGNILNWNGWRVEGMLATSRSLGDHSLKPYVISEPEVTVTKRTESDDFLVIATDGLWDVLCNTFACQVVKICLEGKKSADEAAAALTELAIARGSRDNISVVVVNLK